MNEWYNGVTGGKGGGKDWVEVSEQSACAHRSLYQGLALSRLCRKIAKVSETGTWSMFVRVLLLYMKRLLLLCCERNDKTVFCVVLCGMKTFVSWLGVHGSEREQWFSLFSCCSAPPTLWLATSHGSWRPLLRRLLLELLNSWSLVVNCRRGDVTDFAFRSVKVITYDLFHLHFYFKVWCHL